jgi:AcrR family transcriptional regulator
VAKALSRTDFVGAGAAIVAEGGLDALTTRALGERLGVHSTAIYRHFPDWDGLILAITDVIVGGAGAMILSQVEPLPTARERLAMIARMARGAVAEQPDLAQMIVTVIQADTAVPTPNIDQFMRAVIGQLRALGLHGPDVAVGFQAFEGLLLGTICADYLGAPNHLEHRLARRRMLGEPEISAAVAGTAGVQELNDAAFEMLVGGLLDAMEARATA